MSEGDLAAGVRTWGILAALVAGLLMARGGWTQTDQDSSAPWMAVLEQSVGSEGMYVVEVYPTGEGAATRLYLQQLNAAAQRYQVERPNDPVRFNLMVAYGYIDEPGEGVPEQEFQWDEDRGLFRSSLGGAHAPGYGAARLLEANRAIRQRILQPTPFVRSRWKAVYTDEEAPGFLRREIELREYLLEAERAPEVRRAEALHQQLVDIEEAVRLYALTEMAEVGDPLTFEQLSASGFLRLVERLPEQPEVELSEIGVPPVIRETGGPPLTSEPASLLGWKRQHAAEIYRRSPDYPPAKALRARYERPEKAVEVLGEAIAAWPAVPGLRIERMTHLARLARLDEWTEDLDAVLGTFPSGIHLFEMSITAEVSGGFDAAARARFATVLADVRPDLLTQQLLALASLQEVDRIDDARTIFDRLAFSNPAWQLVLTRPGEGGDAPTESGTASP